MAVRTIEDARRLAHEYYLMLLKAGLPVEKVILFGSYSRNEQKEFSDIDIAVVMKEYHKDRFDTRLELMKYAREFEEVIEPHPFLASEFDETEPFASEILHSGIGIYWNLKYSGGIQEETTYLGIPCVTLRTTTERPITVDIGTNYLVGEDTHTAEKVCLDILNNNFKKGQIPEFWDGHAAERIVEVLVDKVNGEFVNGE